MGIEHSCESRQADREGGAGQDGSSGDGAGPDLSHLAFTVYVRPGASTVTKERQTQVRSRFERLVDAGVIDRLSVENWSKEVFVPEEGTATDQAAVDLFDEFSRALGEAPGTGRLEPFFEERPQVSSFFPVSTTERVIVFPVLGVTVRRAGELVGLYPCWLDGTHHSVGTCLDLLEDGESATNLE